MSAATARAPLETAHEDAFRLAIEGARETLAAQRSSLIQLGCPANRSDSAPTMMSMLESRQVGSDNERMALLSLVLSEINARQHQIDVALASVDGLADRLAVDAFVNAMHRIRTSLDVALGCAEEIRDIGSDSAVTEAAREAAVSIRLVYHYTHELNDLSNIAATMKRGRVEDAVCSDALNLVVSGLTRIASDAAVNLNMARQSAVTVRCNVALLNRALSYLVLGALVSPGVKNVDCAVQAREVNGVDVAQFIIGDDGQGISLEERVQVCTWQPLLGASADNIPDSAGFAVVRRLAKALGGSIEMEMMKREGARIMLSIPREYHGQVVDYEISRKGQ